MNTEGPFAMRKAFGSKINWKLWVEKDIMIPMGCGMLNPWILASGKSTVKIQAPHQGFWISMAIYLKSDTIHRLNRVGPWNIKESPHSSKLLLLFHASIHEYTHVYIFIKTIYIWEYVYILTCTYRFTELYWEDPSSVFGSCPLLY